MKLNKYPFIKYMLKFLLTFCILFYGTIALIGITSPGGYYSAFADHYLDYVSWLRELLLYCSKWLLSIFGYKTYFPDDSTIKVIGGASVHVGYDCIGYGVMIFWASFIFANTVPVRKKIKWMLGGLLLIWIINVLRISLFLLSLEKHLASPFGLDNHTLFNIAAYTAIFTMIYFFDRSEKIRHNNQGAETAAD